MSIGEECEILDNVVDDWKLCAPWYLELINFVVGYHFFYFHREWSS